MANRKISELTATGALTGTELVEVVQGGVNKQTTTQDIADLGGGGGGGVTSVNGDSGPTVNLNANDIPFTPAGTISATDVQAALVELDSDIINAIAGLKWKASVRVATTADGTLATAYENGDTVDGVVLATGDRILIKNQVTQTDNGIYTVNASGSPTRATDADSASELESAAVSVQEGTTNANTTWLQITDSITLGVSNIVWTGFGSSVTDADATTKGIAKLYPSTSLGTNTDGAPTQNAVKVYVDAQYAPRGLPMVSATGAVVSFAIPQIYGLSGDITGNITFSTTGAVVGMEQMMIHNDSVEPSFPSEFKRMEGSRSYVTGVDNIIIIKYLSSTRILYTINQEQ